MKDAPMTRSALRRAIRPFRRALIEWFASDEILYERLPRALKRAGFKMLPQRERGIERTVVLGPGIVVKTESGYRDVSASDPSYRRSSVFAPTISLSRPDQYGLRMGRGVIVQPRGRVMTRCRGSKWAAVRARYERTVERIENRWEYDDTHKGNFALFPDGTVRCIDY